MILTINFVCQLAAYQVWLPGDRRAFAQTPGSDSFLEDDK